MKILILSLFITLPAFANFNGQWQGEGHFESKKNKGLCHDIFFEFSEDQNSFKIKNGGYNCEEMSAEYPFSIFKKKGDQLLYNGEIVGYRKNDVLYLEYYEGLYKLKVIKNEDIVHFSEEWNDGDDYLTISGKLSLIKSQSHQ